jgi:hypothetical protein
VVNVGTFSLQFRRQEDHDDRYLAINNSGPRKHGVPDHPKIEAWGGAEAIRAQVPVIRILSFADEDLNVGEAADTREGAKLVFKDLTIEVILNTLNNII